ncbi:MAG: helix-turn-helix domain-containing protein [Acidimicrobiia bacterium]
MPTTAERYRVDELAEHTATSIDTIRFYQKRGLLPAPAREGRIAWYDDSHVDRLARIRELQGRGLPLALIGQLLEIDPTDAPLAEAVLTATQAGAAAAITLTEAELADAVGVPTEVITAIVREGILTPQRTDNELVFAVSDVTLVRQGLRLLEFGIPMQDLLAIAREHSAMTHTIAEQAVALFDTHVRQPVRASGRSDSEKAAQLVDAFQALLPTVSSLIADHFARVLLEIAQTRLDLDIVEHDRGAR